MEASRHGMRGSKELGPSPRHGYEKERSTRSSSSSRTRKTPSSPLEEWLDENFSNRWIGRGRPRDSNISWPPRSPDLTPMDFFVWGFVKEKVDIKNHENLTDLKESITALYLELANEMISSSLKNMEKRLKLVVERCGLHVEN